MKEEPTIREICGTDSGYRKHRRTNEQYCAPCVEAHNVHRRATYNPDKNRQYATKYKAANPEKIKEASKKYYTAVPEEVKEAKRLAAAERREANRFVKKKAYDQLNAYRSAVTRDRKIDIAIARAFSKEQRRETADMNARLRHQRTSQQKAELQGPIKASLAVKAEVRKLVDQAKSRRFQERLNRPIAHGTTYAEYHQCRRKNPGGVCAPCSEVNRLRAIEWRADNPERVRDNSRRAQNKRRMHTAAAKQVPYTRVEILERDNRTCYLCGGKVNLEAPWQAGQPGWEDYPHIDHVIPLSKGGSDTPDNVRITHARCNMSKSDTLVNTPEMALWATDLP